MTVEIPIVQLHDVNDEQACKMLATSLIETGIVLVKPACYKEEQNQKFLRLMEAYFEQTEDEKLKDTRPHLSYQVGATPSFVEKPRSAQLSANNAQDQEIASYISSLSDENKPLPVKGGDCKWRFFWRIGARPKDTKFPEMNAAPVIPEAFPTWQQDMDEWGSVLSNSVKTVCSMLSKGLGLSKDISEMTENGPHLLAPTGTDLSAYGIKDQVFAGFHYDMNLLTIHGKSNYPGLQVWTRGGVKVEVSCPQGCLLIQAGKQLEILTGGVIKAGFHQVCCTENTISAMEKAKSKGASLWRISSTLFYHIASDQLMEPLLETSESANYKPILAGSQIEEELKSINLMQ